VSSVFWLGASSCASGDGGESSDSAGSLIAHLDEDWNDRGTGSEKYNEDARRWS
jgi:hypothetical protein